MGFVTFVTFVDCRNRFDSPFSKANVEPNIGHFPTAVRQVHAACGRIGLVSALLRVSAAQLPQQSAVTDCLRVT